jgi:hypothetical protein
VSATPERIADDLWRWTARHPEWHPGEFGEEVASFALRAGGDAILIDPLLPPDREPVLELLDGIVAERFAILVSIPYHVRSSEELRRRYRDRADATIWGHPACRRRLEDDAGFHAIEPGDELAGAELPAGASAHRIGRPRRFEMPLHLPSHRALVFGDAVVEADGRLRVWSDRRVDDDVSSFYRERFNPTLEPLLDLDVERVLVTHGSPVLEDGRAKLRAALRAKPWYHRPS